MIIDKPLVSYTIITRNRQADLREAIQSVLDQDYQPLEIVVVDNASTDETSKLFENEFNVPNIKYICLSENRGVAGGRNVVIPAALGEIIITLDDDALLKDRNATSLIVAKLLSDEKIGALGFKSVHYGTHQLEKFAYPFRDKSRDPDLEGEAIRFIGVGHAIPRSVYDRVGLYADFFPYGHEETDLALRILDADYKIIYFPQVTVIHKKQAVVGRLDRLKTMWATVLANRLKVAIRNMPWRYVITTTLAWSVRTLIDTRGNIMEILKSWQIIWRQRRVLLSQRKPLKRSTLDKIKQFNGHLYW